MIPSLEGYAKRGVGPQSAGKDFCKQLVIEDGRPLLERLVGGQEGGAIFITLAKDLEEQVSALFIYGQITEFVNDQQARFTEALELAFEAMSGLSGNESVKHLDGRGEEDGGALLAGGISQSNGEVGFTQAHIAEDRDPVRAGRVPVGPACGSRTERRVPAAGVRAWPGYLRYTRREKRKGQ